MKDKLDNQSLRMIYSTQILPYIDYGCEIWGNTLKCRLEKLTILQKKVIRVIEGLNYLDHTNDRITNTTGIGS